MSILKKYEFILNGLGCPNCANKIQNKVAENKDYKNVVLNYNTLKLSFESDLENVKEDIEKIVKSIEPDVKVTDLKEKHHHEHENGHECCNGKCSKKEVKKTNPHIMRLIIGLVLTVTTLLDILPEKINFIVLILAYVILLYRTTKNALKLMKQKVVNENFLITVSCIGAFAVGEHFEGLMVIILYEIGKILEEKAINNTRKSISSLMDIRPEYANLKHGKHDHKVSPEEVNIDDIIVVKQGEKIPLDGIVMSGKASLNTASLTGESVLREVKENDKVLSGSINEKGLIEVKVTEKYENSTVNKILELVENATDKKAKTETFVNKAAKVYTPIVFISAVLVGVLLPLFTTLTYSESIYRALIFLVVSCPCAIAISVPLSYFSGIGNASKNGILVKGSNYLDALRDIKFIACDKTGTLTKGKFEVEKIKVYDEKYTEEQILEFAAFGESFSNHPLAIAVLEKYGKVVNKESIEGFEEITGKGLQYKLNEKIIKIGNNDLVECEEENETGTIIYVKIDDVVIGCLILNDSIKPEAKTVISELNKIGIKTMMFTGDNEEVAKKVANEIGIKEVKSEMLPTDKYNEIENIIKNKKEGRVAFVGDGINDSPVLALADIGISMGGIGASSAIEASDVVIMTDDLNKIKEAIKISKVTNKIIKQNLIFAIGTKLFVLILTVFGLTQMWLAVFADVGVTLITILNTLRILKRK